MRALYTLLLRCAAPLLILGAWLRGRRDPSLRIDIRQRLALGRSVPPAPAARPLWIHAVSVGEVQACAGLVAALRGRHPRLPLLMTTATATGMARAQRLYGRQLQLSYAPFDLPGAARRFLRGARPRAALFLETELWPNLIAACGAHEVPVALVSARVSQLSMQRYLRFAPWMMRAAVSALALVVAQSRADALRFARLGAGAGRVQVGGNLKFDVQPPDGLRTRATELSARYAAGRAVWVAGSTHAVEEEILLDAQQRLSASVPQALLVLAPRHPQRFDAVADLLEKRGVAFVRHSAGQGPQQAVSVVLVDCLGELLAFYAMADVAFVGGSLVPVGGHNLLEPAALGVATLSGPFTGNAPDVTRLLQDAGALGIVRDAASVAAELDRLLRDPAARQRMGAAGNAVLEANRGAVARTLTLVEPLLRAPAAPDSAQEPPARH